MEHRKSADSFGRIHNQIDPTVYFENIHGSSLREPEADRYGDFSRTPWGATPFNPTDSRIAKYQGGMIKLESKMLRGKPPCVHGGIEAYVETMHLSRSANRMTNNSNSLSDMLNTERLQTNPGIGEVYERACLGMASPTELLSIFEELGMASIELAKLTHLYGYRLEYLELMRQDIKGMVLTSNGMYFDDPAEDLRVVNFDSSVTGSPMAKNAFTVKRKRLVGLVGNTRIFERTSFIIRIDEMSDFDPKLADKIRQIETENPLDMKLGPEIEAEIKRLVEGNDLISTIPLSTTVYAQNPDAQDAIVRKKEIKKNISKIETIERFPELAKAAGARAVFAAFATSVSIDHN